MPRELLFLQRERDSLPTAALTLLPEHMRAARAHEGVAAPPPPLFFPSLPPPYLSYLSQSAVDVPGPGYQWEQSLGIHPRVKLLRSSYTGLCQVTPVILHGVVSPDTPCRMTGVTFYTGVYPQTTRAQLNIFFALSNAKARISPHMCHVHSTADPASALPALISLNVSIIWFTKSTPPQNRPLIVHYY